MSRPLKTRKSPTVAGRVFDGLYRRANAEALRQTGRDLNSVSRELRFQIEMEVAKKYRAYFRPEVCARRQVDTKLAEKAAEAYEFLTVIIDGHEAWLMGNVPMYL